MQDENWPDDNSDLSHQVVSRLLKKEKKRRKTTGVALINSASCQLQDFLVSKYLLKNGSVHPPAAQSLQQGRLFSLGSLAKCYKGRQFYLAWVAVGINVSCFKTSSNVV